MHQIFIVKVALILDYYKYANVNNVQCKKKQYSYTTVVLQIKRCCMATELLKEK